MVEVSDERKYGSHPDLAGSKVWNIKMGLSLDSNARLNPIPTEEVVCEIRGDYSPRLRVATSKMTAAASTAARTMYW